MLSDYALDSLAEEGTVFHQLEEVVSVARRVDVLTRQLLDPLQQHVGLLIVEFRILLKIFGSKMFNWTLMGNISDTLTVVFCTDWFNMLNAIKGELSKNLTINSFALNCVRYGDVIFNTTLSLIEISLRVRQVFFCIKLP